MKNITKDLLLANKELERQEAEPIKTEINNPQTRENQRIFLKKNRLERG